MTSAPQQYRQTPINSHPLLLALIDELAGAVGDECVPADNIKNELRS